MVRSSILSSFTLAWRNLGRNPRRTALALSAILLAQFFVLAVDGFMVGYENALRDVLTGPMLGHAQVHHDKFRDERSMDLVIEQASEKTKAIEALPAVERAFPRLYAPSLAAKTEEGFTSIVLGLDPNIEAQPGGLLHQDGLTVKEGKLSLLNSDKKREALVGFSLARRQDLGIGDEIALIGQTKDGSMASELVTVSGIVHSNVDLLNGNGIIIPLDLAQLTYGLEDEVHEITIRGSDATRAESLSASLSSLPALKGYEVLPWQELAPQLVQMLGMMSVGSLFILIFVFVAAAAGIANTMVMSTFERAREMGVLLALGMGPRRIVGVLVLETLLLGFLGLALGTALGGAFNAYLGVDGFNMSTLVGGDEELSDLSFQGINFDLVLYPMNRSSIILQSVVAMGMTCFLSAIWPARFVSRLEPTEAMRK